MKWSRLIAYAMLIPVVANIFIIQKVKAGVPKAYITNKVLAIILEPFLSPDSCMMVTEFCAGGIHVSSNRIKSSSG